MNTKGFAIEFWDEKNNTPLVTLHGRLAKWLVMHSDLLRTLLELEPSAKGLTIPVSFQTDRIEIFRRLLNGTSMGRIFTIQDSYGFEKLVYEYYPLGPLEEAEIQRELSDGKIRSLDEERARVINEVAGFLMLDPDAQKRFIIFDTEDGSKVSSLMLEINKNEELRYMKYHQNKFARNMTRRRRKAAALHWGLLNENAIERYIENHKNLLYSIHKNSPYGRERLKTLLSKENLETRNQRQKAYKEQRRRRRPRYLLGYRWDSNNSNNNNYYNNGPFNRVDMEGFNYNTVSKMTPIEFERYVRSLRGELERGLPHQTNISLRNFFGNANNL